MKKVIIFLVDGMRSDAVVNVSEAQEIMEKSTYTLKATTVMPSMTLPCHMSLFHSVDPERHGTTTNMYAPQVRPVEGLCEVLRRAGKSCAFFYEWEELRDLTRPGSLIYSQFMNRIPTEGAVSWYEETNRRLADDAIDYIKANTPDFVFWYTGMPDDAGHNYKWMSEKYLWTVEESWKTITKIMNELPDDYTVIITADHGGHDCIHGTDMPEDMIIPVFAKGEDFAADCEFERDVNIKDIAPTVTELLGVAPNPEWKGKSFLNKKD